MSILCSTCVPLKKYQHLTDSGQPSKCTCLSFLWVHYDKEQLICHCINAILILQNYAALQSNTAKDAYLLDMKCHSIAHFPSSGKHRIIFQTNLDPSSKLYCERDKWKSEGWGNWQSTINMRNSSVSVELWNLHVVQSEARWLHKLKKTQLCKPSKETPRSWQ